MAELRTTPAKLPRVKRKVLRAQIGLLPSEWPEADELELPEGEEKPKAQEIFLAQCIAHHLPPAIPNHQFAKHRTGKKFEGDAVFLPYKLIVEIQGGIWMRGGGAHSRPMNIERDVEKQQHALVLGFALLPVTPKDVKNGRAIELTKMLLAARGWKGFAHETHQQAGAGGA